MGTYNEGIKKIRKEKSKEKKQKQFQINKPKHKK